MLFRGHQNVESFLDAVARHLSAPRAWKREFSDDGVKETIVFGAGYWRADVYYSRKDSSFAGISLRSGDYDGDEIEAVEDGIALLEGFSYEEENASADDGKRRRKAADDDEADSA